MNTELTSFLPPSTGLPLNGKGSATAPWPLDSGVGTEPGITIMPGTMQTPPLTDPVQRLNYEPLSAAFLPAEAEFYSDYLWCLNPFPTVREVVTRLSAELNKVDRVLAHWQTSEVATNVFLLSCAIADAIDDYLLGTTYDFSKISRILPLTALAVRIAEKSMATRLRLRDAKLIRLRRWRMAWGAAVTDFLQYALVADVPQAVPAQRDRLMKLLLTKFPRKFWSQRAKIPAFFRSRDFAPPDCLELGRKFIVGAPACEHILVVGLRTAGSFLAPLVCAFLKNQLYSATWTTIRPGKGLSSLEQDSLREGARKNAHIVIVDESIHSGSTLGKAVDLLCHKGFSRQAITVLNPVEPAIPNWRASSTCQSLAGVGIIALEPHERYKKCLLDSERVEERLTEYFNARGYVGVRIENRSATEELNHKWKAEPPARVDFRLKRIYDVHLTQADGTTELRHVIAKSVGWGWLGYHAFIAGQQLAEFVPPVLGLRDGILYSEWLPQISQRKAQVDRTQLIDYLARYISARCQKLRLDSDPTPDLASDSRHKGLEFLIYSLCRAYSSRLAASVMRFDIRQRLSQQNDFAPILTDSKMDPSEWITAGDRVLKTDFEHHCFGKNELSVSDPAFDLATAIFHFGLSEAEAAQLVNAYIKDSGDTDVHERLFLNKLLAGIQAHSLALYGLQHPKLVQERDTLSRQYISGWNFLVGETVTECAKLCFRPKEVHWHAPLAALDIDGVLDRMVFGFPSTTAAGIKAISLLHSHGFAIALNTARTLDEVKHYSRSYGFAGGVAEYGSVIWDAVTNRQVGLVTDESLEQLATVKEALKKIPGCFLNDDYQYSLRAFTYQGGRTVPLHALLVQDLLNNLSIDRLQIHHTGLDTAITAREVDKGTGLLALLDIVNIRREDVLAVGDSEPDLAMFRVAGRAFAPENVTCSREAKSVGCYIASLPCQPGLLEIVRRIIHADGSCCPDCQAVEAAWPKEKNLFVSLLEAADKKPLALMKHVFSPSLLEVFRK